MKFYLCSKDKIHRTDQAQRRPHVIELERFVHVEHREGHEDAERDCFLHDLQLRQAELGVADAVGRHLQQIFEQRDAPADEGRDVPGAVVQAFQVAVPGEGHEDVRQDQQARGLEPDRQSHIRKLS